MNPDFVSVSSELMAATAQAWKNQCAEEDWDQFLVWIEYFGRLVSESPTKALASPHSRIHAVVDPENPLVALALVTMVYKGGAGNEVRLMDVVLCPALEDAEDATGDEQAAIVIGSAFAHTLTMAVSDYSAQRFKVRANAHKNWKEGFLSQLGAAVSAMAGGMFRAEWEGRFLVLIRGPNLALVQ